MKRIYDFDSVIERRNTNCEKWDNCTEFFGSNHVLPFWIADMDFKTPDFIIDTMRKRLEHEVFGYTFRNESTYLSLKNWVKRRAGWDIETKDITFSPGLVPAINFAVTEFTQKHDKVLILTPVYHPFFYAVNDHKRELITCSLQEKDNYYSIDFDDLEKKVAQGVKLLIFSNPHNPVGRVWTHEELLKIGLLCVQYNVILVSDEIHSDLVFTPHKHIHTASISNEIAQQTLTLLAPSKTFNIAALSTSFVHSVNPELLKRFKGHIEKFHLMQGNVFGNIASEAAYNLGNDWLEQLLIYVEGNFEFVIDFLARNIPSITTQKPEATYLMWLDCRKLGMTAEKLKTFLIEKAKLAVNHGDLFGKDGTGFIRLNVATPRSILHEGLNRLAKAISEVKNIT